MNPAREVERLLAFAVDKKLVDPQDVVYCRNLLLHLLRLDEPYDGIVDGELPSSAAEVLEPLLDYAAEAGILKENTGTHRDLFDTLLMGCLVPRPSEVAERFRRIRDTAGILQATDWFYELSIHSDYVKMNRIKRNLYWRTATDYGDLEITVNLSKPEKDPREIALLKNAPSVGYPKCQLCVENVGYAGRLNHPARQTLRVIPLELDGEPWCFQYSPYLYYNEHSIVLNAQHVPMQISDATFRRLFDFLEQFPHYFVGSNADLPIVGGSILNHDHFQGGRHVFPVEKAPVVTHFTCSAYPEVRVGVVKWPMSVIRLNSADRHQLEAASSALLAAWRGYSDESVGIRAFSGRTPHNTITPIARMAADGSYELDLVLRNNRTSEEHPEGIFHPHKELHHIKKENIGLIEVMGLAVLPGRLKEELAGIAALLSGTSSDDGWRTDPVHPLHKHKEWMDRLLREHGTSLNEAAADRLLQDEVGRIFLRVLSDAGVFKEDAQGQAAFAAFLRSAGFAPQQV